MTNWWQWRRADRALAWLVLLGTLVVWFALALSSTGLEPLLALVVTICRRSLSETVAHGAELGRLALILPLAVGFILASVEAHQLGTATRRRITSLSPGCRAPTRRLNQLAARCNLGSDIRLVQAEFPLVFTQGLFYPKVWLSTGLLNMLANDELEAVLRHEAHHRLAHDPLKMLIARCLSRGLFFIPVAHDLCETYGVSKEIAADSHATHAMLDALPLARALRKLIDNPVEPVSEPTLVSEIGVTEARLMALLYPPQPRPLVEFRHLGLSLFWLLLLLVILLAPAAGHLPSVSECSAPIATLLRIAHT